MDDEWARLDKYLESSSPVNAAIEKTASATKMHTNPTAHKDADSLGSKPTSSTTELAAEASAA